MAAPSLNVRVAPSGPLAGSGVSDPFSEYAGAVYQGNYISNIGPDVNAKINYLNASIGPTNAEPEDVDTCYLYREGQTNPAIVATKTSDFLEPIDGDSADFSMGVGKWLVESTISCGYNTSQPEDGGLFGALNVEAFFVTDDGSAVLASDVKETIISRACADVAGVGTTPPVPAIEQAQLGLVHTAVVRQVITVNDADVAGNNNQPFKGFVIGLTRVTSASSLVGIYTSTSGWLEFSRECQVVVRRYR